MLLGSSGFGSLFPGCSGVGLLLLLGSSGFGSLFPGCSGVGLLLLFGSSTFGLLFPGCSGVGLLLLLGSSGFGLLFPGCSDVGVTVTSTRTFVFPSLLIPLNVVTPACNPLIVPFDISTIPVGFVFHVKSAGL